MQRYGYESIEEKSWSMSTILGVTALVSVSVGVTVGLVSSHNTTSLYAPSATSVQSVVGTAAAVPVRSAIQAQAEPTFVEAAPAEVDGEIMETVFEAPQSTNWAPVAALIALPTAIAAFLLRKDEKKEHPMMNAKLATAGLAASAIVASGAMMPMPANATEPIMGLTPCAESKPFQKLLKKEIKALEKREKLYEEGSAPYLALKATETKTQNRFAKYANQGLLCGSDGLPHLIADPGLAVRYGHAGETLIPTVGFLYVAGYIGHAGRTYLQEISSRQKPTQSEIIIDVPLATSIAFKSWDWPGKAFTELVSGKLLEKDENVPVSRR